MEDLLDCSLEVSSNSERQGQRRVISPGFDRIDRLAGDAECASECGLGQLRFLAELSHVILHVTSLLYT